MTILLTISIVRTSVGFGSRGVRDSTLEISNLLVYLTGGHANVNILDEFTTHFSKVRQTNTI